jgi:RNA polymerase sigma-70 factor (ECF subfamily)
MEGDWGLEGGMFPCELRTLAAVCPESLADEELFALLNADPMSGANDTSRQVPTRGELFNELYRRYYGRVQNWCYRVVRNHATAADLTQEVFLKTYRRISSYRGDSKVSTWMFSVTRNHCLSALKRRNADPLSASTPYPRFLLDFNSERPETGIEILQIYGRLRSVMDRYLQPIETQVLLMHYAYGISLASITAELRLANPSGAKAYIVNSRRKLRRALEGNDALAASLRRAAPAA